MKSLPAFALGCKSTDITTSASIFKFYTILKADEYILFNLQKAFATKSVKIFSLKSKCVCAVLQHGSALPTPTLSTYIHIYSHTFR